MPATAMKRAAMRFSVDVGFIVSSVGLVDIEFIVFLVVLQGGSAPDARRRAIFIRPEAKPRD